VIVVDATALVDLLLDKPEAVALLSELSGRRVTGEIAGSIKTKVVVDRSFYRDARS